MDWRIPEKLKKRVSYSRFTRTLRSMTCDVKKGCSYRGRISLKAIGSLDLLDPLWNGLDFSTNRS
jgi:hypothetical protein